jgi:hypothetical protein
MRGGSSCEISFLNSGFVGTTPENGYQGGRTSKRKVPQGVYKKRGRRIQKNAPPPWGGETILSEKELQAELQSPGAMCGVWMKESASREIVVDAGSADAAPSPLRVIEDVEGFGAKLEAGRLFDLKMFQKRHVKVGAARHMKQITPRISESETRGSSKCARIKEQGTFTLKIRCTGRSWSSVRITY